MNGTEDDRLRALLRDALPPLPVAERRPARDLWPDVAARIARRTARPWGGTGAWLDLALAAAAALVLALAPELIPTLLYVL